MKVAFVYDRINKWGGAERILLALHELFPEAPLFTSVYNPKTAAWARVFDVRTSFLQKIPFVKNHHDKLAPLMPLAFELFSFEKFDLIISVTSEAGKGIITHPKTVHACYCLTPTRYLWSGYDEYFENSVKKTLAWPFVSYLRTWDMIASNRPDAYIVISKEVQKRIKTYYNRESVVVYPPVELGEPFDSAQGKIVKGKVHPLPFFLVVSRLVPYKRIDIVIQACNELQAPLKVIGTGSEEERLKRMAGRTVEFVGTLTDEELVEYYKGCMALLYAGYEDFGLILVEAQMFGKPVIAYKKGGASEIVVHRKTGILFDNQSKDSLISAIKAFEQMSFQEGACRKQAEKFGKEKFKNNFLAELQRVMYNN